MDDTLHPMLKRLIVMGLVVAALVAPKTANAEDDQIICPQPYGGGVVCGVKTHKPVETGLGENLAMAGSLSLVASGVFLFLSARSKKIEYQEGL